LQGLVNRAEPRVYVFFCGEFGVDTDQFWFDWARNEDGWLRETEVQKITSLEEAVKLFRKSIRGLVVYDPDVPATSNLASTAAGCEDLLPVRYDSAPGSVYRRLTGELGVPVKLWLMESNGVAGLFRAEPSSGNSAKAAAYKWALQRWLGSRKAAPGIAAYYIDSWWLNHPTKAGPELHTLSNHDYFIARRAFFFDVSPWGDETPNDEPGQVIGTDRKLFLEIMAALYKRTRGGMINVGGFTPWPHKYTTHSLPPNKHEGVPTEWEHARLISQYNGYMEADAAGLSGIANASFFQHYPLRETYKQPTRPGPSQWRARGLLGADGKPVKKLFLGHYVGDYDAPSWVYKAVPAFFTDANLGKVPLGWAFNPTLADRAPQALVYARRHATTNDWFISGDSGAGYLNARALTVRPESGLPSGLDAWTGHCRKYLKQWDLTITGFLLDGAAGASTETEFAAYRPFSPDGIGTHFERAPAIKSGVPTCPERDLPDNVAEAANVVLGEARKTNGRASFLWARSILKRPSWYLELSQAIAQRDPEGRVVVVDPYTFFGLIKLEFEGRR